MRKIYDLILENCINCPANWADAECMRVAPAREFADSDNPMVQVPSWCPLPDAKELS